MTLRANDSTRLAWALFALAVRLGHALGLHRESLIEVLPVLDAELRRRMWWQLITLDGRFAPDAATDRLIIQASFNTKKPLSINDSDVNESTKTLVGREGLTEMTKCSVTHDVFEMAWRLQPDFLPGQGTRSSGPTTDQKMQALTALEQHVTEKVLTTCDYSSPIAWTTWVIGHITIRRARLIVYYPLRHGPHSEPPKVSKDHLLLTAVECMEYCQLVETDPIAARWKWFSSHAPVWWYGLAATLAGLCMQTTGPLVERAWTIVDLVYDDWSSRLARSNDFKVWRPISKLRKRAQALRSKALQRSMDAAMDERAQHTTSHEANESSSSFLENEPSVGSQVMISPPNGEKDTLNQTRGSGLDAMTSVDFLDADFPSSEMDWAEWDKFAQDLRMEE